MTLSHEYTIQALQQEARNRSEEYLRGLDLWSLVSKALPLQICPPTKKRATSHLPMPATNLLAFLCNSDARARFRAEHTDLWTDLCENIYTQKDVYSPLPMHVCCKCRCMLCAVTLSNASVGR